MVAQSEATYFQNQKIEGASLASKTPPTDNQDAILYAFALLLDTANVGLETSQTKAKELAASRSRVSALIKREQSIRNDVYQPQANENYTMEVETTHGGIINYYTAKTPTVGKISWTEWVNGVHYQCSTPAYLIKNDVWLPQSKVKMHSHKGESIWSFETPGQVNSYPFGFASAHLPTAHYSSGHTYFILDGMKVWKSNWGQQGYFMDHHSGYKAIGQATIDAIQANDEEVEKDRAYLTNKINIIKLAQQTEETDLSTTLNLDAQILQQGMKLMTFLDTLSMAIGKL